MVSRQEFSRTTKLKAYAASNGVCQCGCGQPFNAKNRPEYDHRIPCEQGGDNSLENCVVLRSDCHKAKTKDDMKVIAKSRSVRARDVNARTPKAKLPFGKDSPLKKKFDGAVVDRNAPEPSKWDFLNQ